MTPRATERLRRARRRPTDDAGVTLIEVVVALGLTAVFMVMFTGAILQIYGTVNRTQAISDAQSQVNLAMTRLDKEIRYAAAIGEPSTSADPYVEFLTNHTGTKTCHQLWLDVDQKLLKLRQWPAGDTPPSWAGVRPLVGHLSAAQFTVPPRPAGVTLDRLTVRLTAESGSGDTRSQKDTLVTFTALNTTPELNTDVEACRVGRS
jgi:hypothetical protein